METKETTAPNRSQTKFWVVVFAALALVVYAVVRRADDNDARPEQRDNSANAAHPQRGPRIGWRLADSLLDQQPQYARMTGVEGFPEWREYTPAYFRSLKSRRDAVIAWTGSRASRPSIVFIGLIHTNLAEGDTPEIRDAIIRAQTLAFERVLQHANSAAVIAIENSGSDEIQTPDEYARVTRTTVMGLYGTRLTDESIRDMMREDRQAATRAVMELHSPPVICGEEWSLLFETRLLTQGAPEDPQANAIVSGLVERLNILRSETIMIRTLEFMRRVNGDKGIILQGDAHREDIERLANTYHVSVLGLSPE